MAFAPAPIASPALSQFRPPPTSMKEILIVMFGTRRPSVTSMWIQSIPAASSAPLKSTPVTSPKKRGG